MHIWKLAKQLHPPILVKGNQCLPTQAKFLDVFEKILIGGFSSVNTRLAFDLIILFPKDGVGNKKEDLKLIYKVKSSNAGV